MGLKLLVLGNAGHEAVAEDVFEECAGFLVEGLLAPGHLLGFVVLLLPAGLAASDDVGGLVALVLLPFVAVAESELVEGLDVAQQVGREVAVLLGEELEFELFPGFLG